MAGCGSGQKISWSEDRWRWVGGDTVCGTVVTAPPEVDEHAAVEDGAGPERLGRCERVHSLHAHAHLGTEASAGHAHQPAGGHRRVKTRTSTSTWTSTLDTNLDVKERENNNKKIRRNHATQ